MEFTFAVTRRGPDDWVLQLVPTGPGEPAPEQPAMELRLSSRPDCEQAIEMIREAPVRYVRAAPPVVQGSARAEPPPVRPQP